MNDGLWLLLAYLIGSLPFGLVAGKLARNIDIRDYGSGNIGASNAWRILGPRWGFIVFVLDIGKGFAPVFLARHNLHGWVPVLTGFAAITGHNFSVFLKFKGGKGVATSLGAAFGLSLIAGSSGLAVWVIVLALTRYISLASMIAAPAASFLIWYCNGQQLPFGVFGVLATAFVIVKHRSNIQRLKAGTEAKFQFKKSVPISPTTPKVTSK